MYSNSPNRFCVISGTAGNGSIEDGFARIWYTTQEAAQTNAVEILRTRAAKSTERIAKGYMPRTGPSPKLYVVMAVAVVELERPKPAEPPVTVRPPKPDDYPVDVMRDGPMKRGRVHPSDCDDEE